MPDFSHLLPELAWPMTILLAWIAGEYAHQKANLPRISVYAIVGFILAPTQLGIIPHLHSASLLVLANLAFGLILFECGYRINVHWLRNNPWIAVTSLTESSLTFCAVFFLLSWLNQAPVDALLMAALSMATSPATIMRIVNEQRSSGQVTERAIHLSALNCMTAVFVFKVVVGLSILRTSGDLVEAAYNSLAVLFFSVFSGAAAGLFTPALMKLSERSSNDGTLAFAIAVIGLVALAHALKISPILATLTFGMTARHRSVVISASRRGFGSLGNLLSLFLFVFIATTLDWAHLSSGIGLGLAIIAVRQFAKCAGIFLFAHASGISWRKGLLVGAATAPISVFIILALEQTRHLGIDLVSKIAPLAAAALILEILGPLIVQSALTRAGEVQGKRDDSHAA